MVASHWASVSFPACQMLAEDGQAVPMLQWGQGQSWSGGGAEGTRGIQGRQAGSENFCVARSGGMACFSLLPFLHIWLGCESKLERCPGFFKDVSWSQVIFEWLGDMGGRRQDSPVREI